MTQWMFDYERNGYSNKLSNSLRNSLKFSLQQNYFSPSLEDSTEEISGVFDIKLDCSNERFLLSANKNGFVYLFDTSSNVINQNTMSTSTSTLITTNIKCKRVTSRSFVSGVCWYPFDSGLFTAASYDSTIRVFDTETFEEAHVFKFDSGGVLCHALSKVATSHSLIACAVDSCHDIILCDLRSGSQTHRLYGHQDRIYDLQWHSSDFYLLASGSSDFNVKLWDIRKPASSSSQCLLTLTSHLSNITSHTDSVNGLCFSSDGFHLISAGKDSVLLWDLMDGSCINLNSRLASPDTLPYRNRQKRRLNICIDEFNRLFLPNQRSVLVLDLNNDGECQELKGGVYGRSNAISGCCIKNKASELQYLYTCSVQDDEVLIWNNYPVSTEVAPDEEDNELNWEDY